VRRRASRWRTPSPSVDGPDLVAVRTGLDAGETVVTAAPTSWPTAWRSKSATGRPTREPGRLRGPTRARAAVLGRSLHARRRPGRDAAAGALFPTVSFPRVQILVDAGDRPAERMMVEVTRRSKRLSARSPGSSRCARSPVVLLRDLAQRRLGPRTMNDHPGARAGCDRPGSRHAAGRLRGSRPAHGPDRLPGDRVQPARDATDAVRWRDWRSIACARCWCSAGGFAGGGVGGEGPRVRRRRRPVRIARHGLTLAEVRDAVTHTNEVAAVGRLDQGSTALSGVASGQYRTSQRSADGGEGDRRRAGDGRPTSPPSTVDRNAVDPRQPPRQAALLVNVYQQRDASTVAIAREARCDWRRIAPGCRATSRSPSVRTSPT